MNIFPNEKMKRMIDKGKKRMEIELDLMFTIKQHKLHHRHLKTFGIS